MLEKEIKDININPYIKHGIKKLKNKYDNPIIFGLDCETVKGKRYIIQLYNENEESIINVSKLSSIEIIELLIDIARLKLDGNKRALFFVHNLKFEIEALFSDFIDESIRVNNPNIFFEHNNKKYKIFILHGFTNFLRVSKIQRERVNDEGKSMNEYLTVEFIDTKNFFKGTLGNVARELNLPIRKLKKPHYLGEREPNFYEKDYFYAYSLTDAKIHYLLGVIITNMCKEYSVNTKFLVSTASLSSKIFRKHFLKEHICYPFNKLVKLALKSYNGGRTEAFYGGSCKFSVYDMNSAYADAMYNIDVPVENKYIQVTKYYPNRIGFYLISGHIPDMKISPLPYRSEFNNKFIFPTGRFNYIAVTNYEMEEIIKYADDLKIHYGYVYAGKTSDCLKNFVTHFYRKKLKTNKEKEPILYYMSKTIMNGLYGKFIQKNKDRLFIDAVWDNKNKKWVYKETSYNAGGMFNPVIASLITSYVRAKLFKFMKKYEDYVIYCDTDSVFLKSPHPEVETSKKLGDWSCEVKDKKGIIVREKLYLVFDDNDKIIKSALHGFWNSPEDLYKMLKTGNSKYKTNYMISYRQAQIQKISDKALTFIEDERNLQLTTSTKRDYSRKIDFINELYYLKPLNIQDIENEYYDKVYEKHLRHKPKEKWHDKLDDDLIDYEAYKDSSLTKKENKEILDKLWRDYAIMYG